MGHFAFRQSGYIDLLCLNVHLSELVDKKLRLWAVLAPNVSHLVDGAEKCPDELVDEVAESV